MWASNTLEATTHTIVTVASAGQLLHGGLVRGYLADFWYPRTQND